MKARQQAAEEAAEDGGNKKDDTSPNSQEPQPQAVPLPADSVVFDGGFFQVESPAKPSGQTTQRRPLYQHSLEYLYLLVELEDWPCHTCIRRFTKKIEPPECHRPASGLAELQLPFTQKSHPTIPRIGSDSPPCCRLSCPAHLHSCLSLSFPQSNPRACSKVSAWHSSAVPQQKGHCRRFPLFLTCQGSALRCQSAQGKPWMPVTRSWSQHDPAFAFTSIHFCRRGRHTSWHCRCWPPALSLQSTSTSVPGPWAFKSEFHLVTLRDSQPCFHLLPSCCAQQWGPGVCVSHTRQLCCRGKIIQASLESRLTAATLSCSTINRVILLWL